METKQDRVHILWDTLIKTDKQHIIGHIRVIA